tara:strand:- start:81 stop:344 length:264 start_codon:yes stop_codon:yes gene_type:complete
MALTRKGVVKTPEEIQKEVLRQDLIKENSRKAARDEIDVLSLGINKEIWLSSVSKSVLRVQSGWIYSDYDNELDRRIDPVFVPDTRK